MARYYLAKVRLERLMPDGMQKTVTEQYLCDAISFADAEALAMGVVSSEVSEFDVRAISLTKYSEIVRDKLGLESKADAMAKKMLGQNLSMSGEADKWFKCKLCFVTINEKTGKEKKTAVLYLVNAGSVSAAHDVVDLYMEGSVTDYVIEQIDETPILEVLKHD